MQDLNQLPASLSPDEANKLFEEFLKEHAQDKTVSDEALHTLWEISIIQWHTYELIYPQTRKKVQEYLFRVMDLESEKNAGNILGIALNLGIVPVYEYICQEIKNIQDQETKEFLEYHIALEGDHPENPYYSLEQESKAWLEQQKSNPPN